MSTLKVTNIQDTAGGNSSTIADIYSGRAKVWVNFNGAGTVAIRQSFNVSSITDNGTGQYRVNFTNAMPDSNFCAVASSGQSSTDASRYAGLLVNFTTTTCNIKTAYPPNDNNQDVQLACVAVFR